MTSMATSTISIDNIIDTNETVSSESFGINFAFNYQSFGDKPWEKFDEIVEHYGPSQIRYPAGTYAETVFDIENPDATSYVNQNGQTKALTTMTEMLDFARQNNTDAVVVIPTAFALGPRDANGIRTFDASAEQKVRDYVQFLLEAIEDGTISRLEIGNEYASYMTSVEYGRIASAISKIVQEEIDRFAAENELPESWEEPEIAIQIFGQSPGGGNTIEDLNIRNQKVLNEFDADELAAVDAIVDHFYYFDGRNEGKVNEHDIHNIDQAVKTSMDRVDIWENATGRDLTHVVSEWNISHHSENAGGLRQIPYVMELFSEFVKNGVDELDFWSSQYHQSSLYDAYGQAMITGRIFTEFRDVIEGAQIVDVETGNTDVSISAFQSGEGITLFVSSLLGETTQFGFSMGSELGMLDITAATLISVDMASSDGIYKSKTNIPYYQEADVSYNFTDFDPAVLAAEGNPLFTLGAYETIVITLGVAEVETPDPDPVDPIPVPRLDDFNETLFGGLWRDFAGAADDVFPLAFDQIADRAEAENAAPPEGANISMANLSGVLDFSDIDSWVRFLPTEHAGSGWQRVSDLDFIDNTHGSSATLTGTAGDDAVILGVDKDDVYAGAGNDLMFFSGSTNYHWLHGGDGFDQADFSDFGSAISVALDVTNQQVWTRGTDTYLGTETWDLLARMSDVESVVATDFDDYLRGDDAANILCGMDGDDRLIGKGGDDVISAGLGDDNVNAGDGNDLVFITGSNDFDKVEGGAGRDMVDFSGFGSAVSVALDVDGQRAWTRGTDTFQGTEAWDLVALLSNVESLTGTKFDDYLRGDDGANILRGLDGDDHLIGKGGNDVISAGLGDDLVHAGDGDDLIIFTGATTVDQLNGDAGMDAVDFSGFGSAISVTLDVQGQGVWTRGSDSYLDGGAWRAIAQMSSIEAVVGTDYDDYLRGDAGHNELAGGAGDDRLVGGAGNDIFVFDAGDIGHDVIGDFELGIDLIAFSSGSWGDLTIEQQGTSARITHAEGTITLQNTDAGQLTVQDFLFG